MTRQKQEVHPMPHRDTFVEVAVGQRKRRNAIVRLLTIRGRKEVA